MNASNRGRQEQPLQPPDGRWVWKTDPTYTQQRVLHGPPLSPFLQRVACPTLVGWGMESDVLSEPRARRMVAALPSGGLVAVPSMGHAPTLMEPVARAALELFLGARKKVVSLSEGEGFRSG